MSSAARSASSVPAVLHTIDWGTYTRLLRALEARRRFRLTYDRGTLEIMSPLWEHENPAYVLGRFVDVLTEELQLPCRAGGSVTLRRKRTSRGLEPDKCYGIASATQLQGRRRLDLRIDPPPGLAIEVDIRRSSLDRMSIYAALGVPGVWRLTSAGLAFHILHAGSYQTGTNSLSFPLLTSADLAGLLNQLGQVDDTALAVQFRNWVQQVLLKRPV
jgi:Uma2 family endonuclease